MSQGRLIFGLGVGGHVPEAIFGYSSELRARRFVEGIQAIKALWTAAQSHGQRNVLELREHRHGAQAGAKSPHPPIWFGAREERPLRRAVRHGDGWMGAGSSSTKDFIRQSGLIRQFLDEAGRDPATFTISKRIYIAVDNDRARAEQRLREWFGVRYKNADMASQVSVWGSLDECRNKIGEIVRAGAEHLLLNPAFDDMEHLEICAKEIIPRTLRTGRRPALMITMNEHYLKLQASYLFSDIAKRVNAYQADNPDQTIIRLGIGDVTRALPEACITAFHRAVDEMADDATFRGYGPELGYDFLQEAVVAGDFQPRGVTLRPDEVFVSDGAKCDSGNFQELFSLDTRVAVPDPVYPVYVDTNVMAGRTAVWQGRTLRGAGLSGVNRGKPVYPGVAPGSG